MKNGYSICFNEWALDKDIKNELGLLLIISSLCAEKGYCYASNKYLAEIFDTNEITISRKIKLLESKNYISIEYEKRGCQVISRKLRLAKMLIDDYQNCKSTINKNVKENIISNNNINNNIIRKNYNKKEIENDDLENKFNTFWKEYPKKVSKENARKWFIKNKPSDELFNKMIKSLERFKELDDWKKQNGKYIPYPSTWLNQKRWEDEFETDEEKINRIFDELED